MGNRRLLWFSVSFVFTVYLSIVCTTVINFFIGLLAYAVTISGGLLLRKYRKSSALVVLGCVFAMLWQSLYFTYSQIPSAMLKQKSHNAEVSSYSEVSNSGTGIFVNTNVLHDNRTIRVRVFIADPELSLCPGDEIAFEGYLKEYENDEYFAEKTYYKSRYIDAFAFAEDYDVVSLANGVELKYIPAFLAKSIKEKVNELYTPRAAAFVNSLVLGDKSNLSGEFENDLRATGMSHAVSVSGLHVSILVGFLILLTKNKYYKLITIPVIFLFALSVGAPQSALRAVIMQTMVLCAAISNREYDSLTALSFSAFLLVLINPYCVADVAFLLSFFATLGIILLNDKIMKVPVELSKGVGYKKRKLLLYLASSASVSISASLFTTPISAVTFGRVSVIAPLANTIFNFFITAIFVVSLFTIILGFIFSPIAKCISYVVSAFIGVVMDSISALARLPFAEVFANNNVIVAVLCFVCAVLGYFIFVGRKRVRIRFVALSLVVGVLGVICISGLSAPQPRDGVRFDVLDVGQGQCIVVSSGEDCVVVDCGGEKNSADVAVAHLLSNNIYNIDALVLTHAHADHSNGTEYLMDRVDTKRVYMPASDKNDSAFVRLKESASPETEFLYIDKDESFELGDIKVSLITLPASNDDNESGIVVIVSDGEFDTLITGDISSNSEELIIDRIPDCESYVVGHHGSKTSTSVALLNKALPELCVISAGVGNSYGHPAEETLGKINKIGAEIARTDVDGTITFFSR